MRKFWIGLLLLIALLGGASSASAVGAVIIESTAKNVFVPDAVTISVGETVTWNNVGGFHNVVIALPSGNVSSGEPSFDPWTFSYTFTEAGTFEFWCDPHQSIGMDGTVTVEGPTAVTLGSMEAVGSAPRFWLGLAAVAVAMAGIVALRRRA